MAPGKGRGGRVRPSIRPWPQERLRGGFRPPRIAAAPVLLGARAALKSGRRLWPVIRSRASFAPAAAFRLCFLAGRHRAAVLGRFYGLWPVLFQAAEFFAAALRPRRARLGPRSDAVAFRLQCLFRNERPVSGCPNASVMVPIFFGWPETPSSLPMILKNSRLTFPASLSTL